MIRPILSALLLFSIHLPATAAHPEDLNLNRVYAGLVQARAAGDVEGMAAAFPDEAILIDARPGAPLGGGRELVERLRPMAARLTADGVDVQTQYRVERRSVTGDVAVDAGYMRMRMQRGEAEPFVRYARFLVTMRRNTAGQWRIIADASMPAEEAAWNTAPRVPGLQYDG